MDPKPNKMNSFLLLVLLAVLSTAYGLRCYQCSGKEADCTKEILEGNKTKYTVTCTTGADTCMRMWGQMEGDDISVTNTCSTKQSCDEVKKKCEDNELRDENDQKLKKCAIACCSSDECNGSSKVSLGMILMAACSIFGLALIK
ncbi:uncharacterized protein LOC111334609 [Stylophora pistillata]|uniref:UPAR/Ly6 domain-containing protein n=1 Tax=Stylophora pistillata TaxID=50429 RepID=A0A2B4RY96_STYPI|nr:uncharacterized protein LOC111334609 [Stylophora pistillata]PFX22136.1 hypothetical protein AWC38_SpisGene13349 [Stylophora pistillata]